MTTPTTLDQLHTAALKIAENVDAFLGRSGERVIGATLAAQAHVLLTGGATVTLQALRNELHRRAINDREDQAHLTSVQAATRHLATLIEHDSLDGETVNQLGHDEFGGMTWLQRRGQDGENTYRFLTLACAKFGWAGYDLLRAATHILNWW